MAQIFVLPLLIRIFVPKVLLPSKHVGEKNATKLHFGRPMRKRI